MQNRDIDLKVFQSMPDDFDIVKVATYNVAGNVIRSGLVIKITGKAASKSGFGELPLNTVLVTQDTHVLVADDTVTVLGVVGNYAGIQIIADTTFPNDATSVVLNGKGKNLSVLGELAAGTLIYGAFNRIALAGSDTDSILLAYK